MIQCGLQVANAVNFAALPKSMRFVTEIKEAPFPKGAVADNLLAVTEG